MIGKNPEGLFAGGSAHLETQLYFMMLEFACSQVYKPWKQLQSVPWMIRTA